MKNLFILFIILFFSCTQKKVDLVLNSKLDYEDTLYDIADVENVSSNSMLSEIMVDINIKEAEYKGDSLLVRIYKTEKEKFNLDRKLNQEKILRIKLRQDSLLMNDTILINRGIKNTDDFFDIESKFEYYKSAIKNLDSLKNVTDSTIANI